jgi:hypothetical protein
VPQSVVDDAKFPRITIVSPVTDRASLAASWETMNPSLAEILREIGRMNDQEIPMQKPISSERNGYTTWFYPLPFFNDDFVPSVTVGDEWFAASTSKNHALDLLAKAGAEATPASGLRMHVNFLALGRFIQESTEIIAKHPDAIPVDEEDLEKLRKLAAAMEEFDKLVAHIRRDHGVLRTSVHFKTR